MALRFANTIFEPIWSRNYVQSVQITSAETLGVEKRGAYYDNAGALRELIQHVELGGRTLQHLRVTQESHRVGVLDPPQLRPAHGRDSRGGRQCAHPLTGRS